MATWNLWWRFGGFWRERQPAIAAVLRSCQPDVIALVETWPDQTRLLADGLGFASAWAPTSLPPAPDPPEEPSQAGIEVGIGLVSRWPLLAVETHNLPHAVRPGPPPTALLATLDHPRAPLHVIATCLEWEPEYSADQLAQAEAVAELATDPRLDGDLPVLVMGDLNADVTQPGLAPLLASLTDVWQLAGGDPTAVTLSSAVPEAPVEATEQINRRIDHILARPGHRDAVLSAAGAFLAGDQPVDGRFPSDHFAVVADLDLSPHG